jgi:hypothetical protein
VPAQTAGALLVGAGAAVIAFEEPALTRKLAAAYEEYCRNVPRWLPRLTPWNPEGPEPSRVQAVGGLGATAAATCRVRTTPAADPAARW